MEANTEPKYLFDLMSPEFKAGIREVIRDSNFETLQDLIKHTEPQTKFVNQSSLKQMLGIGQEVLNEMLANGLPCYKLGRQVLYRLSDVEEIITTKYRI